MKLERTIAPIALAAVLIGLLLGGCGGSDASGNEGEESQTYGEVLEGMRKAALAEEDYEAMRRAKQLKPSEEAAIDAFCETAWQLAVNGETRLLQRKGFMFVRIRGRAEVLLGRTVKARREALAAMPEIQRVFDLASYDWVINQHVKKACDL